MNKIFVVGLGSYGSAIATILSKNPENHVTGFTRSPNKSIDKYLSKYSEKIVVRSLEELNFLDDAYLKRSVIILALPTSAIEDFTDAYYKFITSLDNSNLIVNLAKGVVKDKLAISYIIDKFTSINDEIEHRRFSTIFGPSFSSEADKGPMGLTFTCSDHLPVSRVFIEDIFKNTGVVLDFSDDHDLTSTASVLKNIYSIITGFVGNEINSVSTYHMILTKIIKEYARILSIVSPRSENHLELYSTIGDLLLTSSSSKSRNRVFGEMLSNGLYQNSNDGSIIYEGVKSVNHFANNYDQAIMINDLKLFIDGDITKPEFINRLMN